MSKGMEKRIGTIVVRNQSYSTQKLECEFLENEESKYYS